MRDHGRVAHKARGFAHDFVGGRRGFDHGVGDAGQLGDERRYPGAGVHQALVAAHDVFAFQQHDGDFGGARVVLRADARGFKVDDGDRGRHARLSIFCACGARLAGAGSYQKYSVRPFSGTPT